MSSKRRIRAILVASALCLTLNLSSRLRAQAPPSQPEDPHAGMNMSEPMDMGSMHDVNGMSAPGSEPGLHWTDAQWSVFNHRGAGWFLFAWGLLGLIAGLQWQRRKWVRFLPVAALFGLVEFLFLRNDPEAWPVGPIGLWASLRDPEVLQHRVFLLLVLAMAIVELLRAADRLPPLLYRFALPGLALFGGIYLFFHHHGGAAMQQMMEHMSDPAMASSPAMKSMMASMDLVKHEHLWFSLLGFGLGTARVLGDTGRLKGRLGATLWSVFAIALGVYMIGYIE